MQKNKDLPVNPFHSSVVIEQAWEILANAYRIFAPAAALILSKRAISDPG
jgi:hypothetical protein